MTAATSCRPSVNLPTVVQPRSVTVNSSSLNYSFSGVGGIGGPTGLLKQGSGTLSIDTINSFTRDDDNPRRSDRSFRGGKLSGGPTTIQTGGSAGRHQCGQRERRLDDHSRWRHDSGPGRPARQHAADGDGQWRHDRHGPGEPGHADDQHQQRRGQHADQGRQADCSMSASAKATSTATGTLPAARFAMGRLTARATTRSSTSMPAPPSTTPTETAKTWAA